MIKNNDDVLAEKIGMSKQNLIRTYKKSPDERKRYMYYLLNLGRIADSFDISLDELRLISKFKENLLLSSRYKKVLIQEEEDW